MRSCFTAVISQRLLATTGSVQCLCLSRSTSNSPAGAGAHFSHTACLRRFSCKHISRHSCPLPAYKERKPWVWASKLSRWLVQVRTSHITLSRDGHSAALAAHERVRGLIDNGAAYRNQAAAAGGGLLAGAAALTLHPAPSDAALPASADAACHIGGGRGAAGAGSTLLNPARLEGNLGGPSKPGLEPTLGGESSAMASQAAAWAGTRAAAERRAGGGGGGNPYGANSATFASELARRSPAYSPSDAGRRRASRVACTLTLASVLAVVKDACQMPARLQKAMSRTCSPACRPWCLLES